MVTVTAVKIMKSPGFFSQPEKVYKRKREMEICDYTAENIQA